MTRALLPAMGLLCAFCIGVCGLDLAWKVLCGVAGAFEWLRARQALARWRDGLLELDAGGVRINAQRVSDFSVKWRGPLTLLRWRDARGRRHARLLCPGDAAPAALHALRLNLEQPVDAASTDLLAP